MNPENHIRGIVFAMLLGAVPGHIVAATNMLFILDGSNSMWGQIEGKSKISSAQEVLGTLLTDLPDDTRVGLMSYGHRDKTSCTDIELLSPIGVDKADQLTKKINGIQPTGKTPIAASLAASIDAFAKHEGENNHVVLISDGLESCNGDPCAAAGLLASANIKARVHVVGFDVGEEERKKLECISEQGGGKYFSAGNTRELKLAVAEVQKAAVAPPPPPAAPVITEFFRDDFDSEGLADHWEVLNPNLDAFIVEDGKLLVVDGQNAFLDNAKKENIFRLTQPLPKGDWVATMQMSYDYQTGHEIPFLGVYEDEKNFIISTAYSWSYYEKTRGARMWMGGQKYSKGKKKNFEQTIWGGPGGIPFTSDQAPNPILVRLTKKGRTYTPAVKLLGVEDSGWIEHDKFTILRQKGGLVFGLYQGQQTSNETTMFVDWIKIEAGE